MRKLIVALLLASMSIFSVNAQNVAKGKEILGKVSKKYKSFKSIKADFKYTLEAQASKMKEEQKGTFYLKDKRFKLDMSEQMVTCDGKTMWTYLKKDNIVQKTKFDPKAMNFNPSEIFSIYEKGYQYAYIEDEGNYQVVELIPTDKKQSVFKIKLFIDKVKNTIGKCRRFEKNGNIYTYEITNLNGEQNLADNFFVFDKTKYPKVEEYDMQN